MQIKKFLRESFNDYSGKISAVVFAGTCNYRCPSCHAKNLLKGEEEIDEKEFFDYLDSRKGWIDGVVICGGEPTLQNDLPEFAEKIKKKNLPVKLDTNGSNYAVLEKLLESKLVNYTAMDVKGPSSIYADLIGKDFIDAEESYEKAIRIVSQFPDYEFRTTIVPVARRNSEIRFMTPEEIGETAKLIYDCTGNNEHKYFLQPFVPRRNELIDKRLENFPETPKQLLEECLIEAKKYLPNTKIR
ncbi:7-carboxy-7-deazaguanine synthase [uncultured archaeon]|nr:7-carboxy-7-deazaguanine synthase [uncultured archaeon]